MQRIAGPRRVASRLFGRSKQPSTMSNILDKIVAVKNQEIAALKATTTEEDLRSQLANAPPVRDFFAALAADGPIKLIAEVKKASPSKGVIREDFEPVEIARTYETHGATCLSVLTDESFFQGSLGYLTAIRREVRLPVLRKDFLLEPIQLVEARLAGADAVLLIAECLDDAQLRRMHDETVRLGMTPLVEVYAPENLPRVLGAGCRLIGVNNRDLKTFLVDLGHTVRMRERIPADRLVVGESGIHSRGDVERLADASVNAILVGEHLIASPDIGAAVDALLGRQT
jgi:indole-3-glycerol phosphate synthase